jgi:ABC-2 type transport system ATP-binding protein
MREYFMTAAASKIGESFTMVEVVLDVQNLTKIYGKVKRVDNVSFQVYAGEVFGFLGPNGAGKTTTIRMISGLATMSSGEIFIGGHSVKKNFKKAVSCLGGIIENPEMYKYMSGYDNMKYYASLYDGITDEDIWEVVKLVKMENRIHEKVKKYSLGMRQRVGIAQSLLHHPRILILDEPTNGLDPAGIHEMRDFLKMLAHERGYSVFISSHILTEMQLLCDRVGIIANGKLLAVKSMDEWTEVLDGSVNLKMNVTDGAKAKELIEEEFKVDVAVNKSLINFTVRSELVQEISTLLARSGIAVLSMYTGEKSLEDTFLELTSSAGTAVK